MAEVPALMGGSVGGAPLLVGGSVVGAPLLVGGSVGGGGGGGSSIDGWVSRGSSTVDGGSVVGAPLLVGGSVLAVSLLTGGSFMGGLAGGMSPWGGWHGGCLRHRQEGHLHHIDDTVSIVSCCRFVPGLCCCHPHCTA